MKFGTLVAVQRGGGGTPGTRGSSRVVHGIVVGACQNQIRVKLIEDDPLDTVGWSKAGDIGWWSKSVVKEVE